MVCKKCGKQISDDAVYCPNCGAKVVSVSAEEVSQAPVIEVQKPKSRINRGLLITLIALAGSLLFISYISFSVYLEILTNQAHGNYNNYKIASSNVALFVTSATTLISSSFLLVYSILEMSRKTGKYNIIIRIFSIVGVASTALLFVSKVVSEVLGYVSSTSPLFFLFLAIAVVTCIFSHLYLSKEKKDNK
jgi:RNA polymerase subunit RPABC4/transcription elongation factor Spt4